MKEERKNGVKKFQYVSPIKHETLPQQWAKDNILKNSTVNKSKPGASGVNLDNVWSIKRNFAIEPTPGPLSSSKVGHHNSFYSRYKNLPSHNAETNNMLSVPVSQLPVGNSKVWNRGSTQTSNTSSSPAIDDFILDDADEFDNAFNHRRAHGDPYSPVKEVNISKKNAMERYGKPM